LSVILVCVAFLKGIFVDSDFDYKVEDFIDIFTKGILKVEETKEVLGKAEKLQKLKEDIARKKEDLNHLSEQIQRARKRFNTSVILVQVPLQKIWLWF